MQYHLVSYQMDLIFTLLDYITCVPNCEQTIFEHSKPLA